ncbi:MAG TPA: M56 family metallopeptidase [Clostridiales bacterium]|nr:M56 family metallopeptidase [Clostridiales bacterium]
MKGWVINSSLLILIVLALRYVLKGKISSRLRYALWIPVLLRLLIPINFGGSAISIMNMFPSGNQTVGSTGESLGYISNVQTAFSATNEYNSSTLDSSQNDTYNMNPNLNTNPNPGTLDKKFSWIFVAKTIWLAGIVIFGMSFLISNVVFFCRLKKSRIKADIDGYPLTIYNTDSVPTPCMYGLLRPAIYVTSEVLGNEIVLRYVLEHETTHWQHKDHIWSLLRCMCLALHWYNPLVWVAAIYSIQDAELSCDEATIKRIGEVDRTEYGRTLIGLTCAKRSANTLLVAATTMTGSKKSIKERITLIAKKPKMAIYTLIAVLLIAAIAVGCTFTGAKGKKDKIVPLTDKEIQQYNKVFETISFDEQDNVIINPFSHFFKSYYDRPEDIDLALFLRYFPSEEDVTDKAEFRALMATENWPFGADMTMERMPVPIHKFPTETINRTLQKNMGITLDDLKSIETESLIYLKEYDAYYNFTSDFAAGTFYCTHGETQGDIIRLYNEFVTLTLKKCDDGFLFVSHQRIEKETHDINKIKDFGIAVSIKPRGHIPEAVLDYALEFVTKQIDHYNNIGKNPPSGSRTYTIDGAKIINLTKMNTGTASLVTDIQMWLLEYRLRPDNPNNVVLAGGMIMEDMEGETWITEWGSTGQPYLVLAHNIEEDTWERICITNTDAIMFDYNTPEMLERYGDKYTAAAMELYQKATTEQINEISEKDMLRYIEEEIYIPGDAKEYLEKRELSNPSLLINDDLLPIYDKYKETLNDELLKGLRPLDILRLRNKTIEEEDFDVRVNLIIFPSEINRDDFLETVRNDEITKENEKLLLEKYRQYNGKVIEIIVSEGKAYVVIQNDGFWRFEKTKHGVWKLGWLSRQ